MSIESHNQGCTVEPTVPKLLLTPKEASRALAVSEKTLWTYTKSCNIPVVRIGRAVRYDPEDLKKFIQNRKGAG